MTNPVDRFCEMLTTAELPEAQSILSMACLCLGCDSKPTGVKRTPQTKVGEMFHKHTVEDLRKRLSHLIDHLGVHAEILVSGMLHLLINHYEKMASPDHVSSSIDKFLDMKRDLEEELERPIDERRGKRNDDQVQKLIASVEGMMTRSPSNRELGERISSALRTEWEKWFSESYWEAWNSYELRLLSRQHFSTDAE
jgi:hypothetical protein